MPIVWIEDFIKVLPGPHRPSCPQIAVHIGHSTLHERGALDDQTAESESDDQQQDQASFLYLGQHADSIRAQML